MATWADASTTSRTAAQIEDAGATPLTTLTAPAGGITLTSGGYYRNLVVDASALTASSLFTATSATDIVVENVRITGLNSTSERAFTFTGCSRVTVRHCTISGCYQGIMFDACDDVAALGNVITVTASAGATGGGYGILFYANAAAHKRAVIAGNRIVATQTYSHGIFGWGSDSGVIANPVYASDIVVADNIVDTAEGGIWFSKCQGVSVTGNTVRNCRDVGIDFEGCLDSVASGNTLYNCKLGSLAVLNNCKRIAFTGNTVTADAFTSALGAGHLSDTSWLCVYVRDQNEDITITGNVFASVDGAGWMGEINIWKNGKTDATQRLRIGGNRFYRTGLYCVGEAGQLSIDGNDFYGDFNDQTDGPLVVIQSGGVAITDNRFALVSDSAANTRVKAPIRVIQNSVASTPRTTNVLVEGNQILNYPATGIDIDTYNGTDYTATFVVRNNEVAVVWRRTSAAATRLVSGNVLPTAPQTASTETLY